MGVANLGAVVDDAVGAAAADAADLTSGGKRSDAGGDLRGAEVLETHKVESKTSL